VDALDVLQDAIDLTQAALDHYRDPHPGILEVRAEDVLIGGSSSRDGWIAGVLQRLLLEVADDHQGCPLEDCRTCDAVAESLIISLDSLRSMHRQELEQRLSEPAAKRKHRK
jgi:hypothetical protein